MNDVDVSIIVPTLNEAENLPSLLARIAGAVGEQNYEVLIVDDNSKDNTSAVCAELVQRFPARLIVRQHPKDGLSGAVLVGMREAIGKTFVVMDADLQHPPEQIPSLLTALDGGSGNDFVIGSRYVAGGKTDGKWSFFRKLNSWVATFLARPFCHNATDPMSGFFALRRSTYDRAERLTPLGYKIGLELMCKARIQLVTEVPIHFRVREHGESKLTLKQQFRYLEHLSRLYDFTFPRASPVVKFVIALLCSWTLALIAYAIILAAGGSGFSPIYAPMLSYPVAIAVIALFHLRYVRTQREFLTRPPWRDFAIIAIAEWLTCAIVAAFVAARFSAPVRPVELFLYPFAAATAVRYLLRKELLQDIRGLRREPRSESIAAKSG